MQGGARVCCMHALHIYMRTVEYMLPRGSPPPFPTAAPENCIVHAGKSYYMYDKAASYSVWKFSTSWQLARIPGDFDCMGIKRRRTRV
jgi:hypothetical protein